MLIVKSISTYVQIHMICQTFSQLTVFFQKRREPSGCFTTELRGENCRMSRSNLQLLKRRCRWWALLIRCPTGVRWRWNWFGWSFGKLTKNVCWFWLKGKMIPSKKRKKKVGWWFYWRERHLLKRKTCLSSFQISEVFFLNSLRLDGGEWVLDQPTEERSVSGWIMGSLHHPNLVVCVGTSLSWGFGGW